jgi:hypothetical protein
MADVDYEVAAKFTGEDDLRRGATAFEDMGNRGRRALDGIEEKARGGLGLLNLSAGINVAKEAFGALSSVASTVMGALSEGAALADARGDFADLSAEINTTADALEGRLAQATGGLVTNAQLVADASGLMALNLGLTEDEIVGFAGAAAELDWNMEALADTLNTGATRGLKEMGLNITDVKARMAELEAQGVATDEAFRMAILEAAEEKIGRVGKKSEEAAGQIQKLGVMWTTATDSFKENFAQGVADQLNLISGLIDQVGPGVEQGMAELGARAGSVMGEAIMELAATGMEARAGDMEDALRELGVGWSELGDVQRRAQQETGRTWTEIATQGDAALAYQAEYVRQLERMIVIAGGYEDPRISTGNADNFRKSARVLSEWTQEAKDAAIASAELSGELAGLDLSSVAGATQSGIWAAAGGHIQSILDEASAAADEEAAEIAAAFEEAFRDAALRSSGYFSDAINALQDYQVPDIVTPERDISYTVSGPSQEQLNLMEEYRERYDNAATAAYELSVGIGTVGLSQEQLNERVEKANAEMGHYSGLMAGLQLPATETATAHRDLAFDMDLVQDAMYAAGEAAGWSVVQIGELGIATGEFSPAAADAAQKTALFYSALDILAQERKLGNLDTGEYIAAVDQLVADLEANSVVDLQLKLAQVENPARELWAWLPAEERQGVEIPVKFTAEQEALQAAIDLQDGVPDNAEKLITFTTDIDAVTTGTENVRGMVEAITGTNNAYPVILDMDIGAVTQGSGEATRLINSIPASRTITINWAQSGVDVIAALQALGILP